ncbi:isopenicillin-N N-acyltransferase like protein [Cupriavidus sp. YR651]|uniref:C45 family autoproteolytic acyltransferase/hydolase n=1 Tax=Cupriavidus sp. YR651 TaxID=1855315 RepID=UPI00088CB50A|nr:C45 family peptidase [Cupriavidus sp. YR651]SDB98080.1 isopenicillin-N N-acyltransferase like protein [Cupriavidus sp. YR651]
MTSQQSFPTTAPELPLIEVSGAPRERGRQYGEQAAPWIKRGIAHYSRQLETSKLSWKELQKIVATFEPTIAAFDPTYIDEMHGIAEGAGVEYAAVVMLNARTEVLKLADRMRQQQPVPIDPDGCTGVIALPEATASGRVIHAQNWDWKAECAESSVVLKVHREDGPDYLTFTEAGALARSGMNAAGISITANYLECERDYRTLGVPLALIRRKVLEQERLAFAMQAVYVTAKSAANNIMVAHAGGVGIDFECAPDETFQLLAEQGVIVHANHWKSPVALGKLRELGIQKMPDSLYRDERVRQLVLPHAGQITVDTIKNALFDDFETPWSVCRPPRPNSSNNLSATVAMIVMEPEQGVMEVSMLPALFPTFSTFRLDMEIARPKSAGAGARRAVAA